MNFIILSPKVQTVKAKLRSIRAFDVTTTADTCANYTDSPGIRKYLAKKGIKVH